MVGREGSVVCDQKGFLQTNRAFAGAMLEVLLLLVV